MNRGLKKPLYALMFSVMGRGTIQQERLFIIRSAHPTFLSRKQVVPYLCFTKEG